MNTRTIGMATMLLRHKHTDTCRNSGLEAWRTVPVHEGQSGDDVIHSQRCSEVVVSHMKRQGRKEYICNARLECVEYLYTGEGA